MKTAADLNTVNYPYYAYAAERVPTGDYPSAEFSRIESGDFNPAGRNGQSAKSKLV